MLPLTCFLLYYCIVAITVEALNRNVGDLLLPDVVQSPEFEPSRKINRLAEFEPSRTFSNLLEPSRTFSHPLLSVSTW